MRRLTFLLGLFGAAVAKGQSLFRIELPTDRTKRWISEVNTPSGVATHIVDAAAQSDNGAGLRPKSGHCPLDGTKGIKAVMIIPERKNGGPVVAGQWLVMVDAIAHDMYTCYRCPHCGMLFTATAEKGRTQ